MVAVCLTLGGCSCGDNTPTNPDGGPHSDGGLPDGGNPDGGGITPVDPGNGNGNGNSGGQDDGTKPPPWLNFFER
jgi:hypothetical protein